MVILSMIMPNRFAKKTRDDLRVSLIIAAYNEEKVIEDKIKNSLELDYPTERFEIIVASDGSTDRTDEIVKEYSDQGVILIRVEGRKGKTETQNQAVKVGKGDILIFSDANGLYKKDAVRRIVENFHDPSIGGVSGGLIYLKSIIKEESEEKTYWDFENILKEKESSVSSILGTNGSIYAIRKDLYVPLSADMISDLVEPLKILEKGYRVVYEKLAISLEDLASVSSYFDQDFRRRVRISTRTIVGLFHCLKLLNFPKYGLVSLQFFSHKILRYLMPFILPTIFVLNIFILGSSRIAALCFMFQCIFYLLSGLGYLQERLSKRRSKVLSIPWYFVWSHAAIFLSFFKLLQGKRVVVWETVR